MNKKRVGGRGGRRREVEFSPFDVFQLRAFQAFSMFSFLLFCLRLAVEDWREFGSSLLR